MKVHFLINNFIFIYILHSKYLFGEKIKISNMFGWWVYMSRGNCPVDICLRRICPDINLVTDKCFNRNMITSH